jgi:hypothetical protein
MIKLIKAPESFTSEIFKTRLFSNFTEIFKILDFDEFLGTKDVA